ncbi:MAG: hypothetical protein K2X86_13550, partial [Cytophagaceae bacterium]|nr:hypothetical protein [Cytophagaceae bacterium]
MKFKIYQILLCFLFAAHFASAEKIIVLTDSTSFVEPRENVVDIYEDKEGDMNLQQILSIDSVQFSNYNHFYNHNTNSAYWIKFVIDPKFEKNRKWVLEILDSRFSSVALYYPDEKGKYIKRIAGLQYPFYTREYGHKNFVIDLDFTPGKRSVCYLRLKSDLVGSFIFKIRSNHEFSTYAFNEYYLLGLYYGILIIIILYNLILYFTLKEKLYLYYLFYVVVWAWYSLLDDGIGFQYIWSGHPWISTLGFYLSKPLLAAFFVAYSRQFLNISIYNNKFDKWVKYITIVFIANEVLTWLFGSFSEISFFRNLSWILFTFPFLFIYYISLRIYMWGYKPARFFILGNSLIILGLILRTTKFITAFDFSTGSIFLSIIIVYSLYIGRIFEIVIFSSAQGDRIRYLKEKEREAQEKVIEQLQINESLNQKVNKELEEKVMQRTKDLMEKSDELRLANARLAQQAEEINRWNQLLDLDNHNLKNKVKEVVEARIKFKDVSFEEFLTIFPDDLSCERYLDEIKWKGGFKCKKCGNEK